MPGSNRRLKVDGALRMSGFIGESALFGSLEGAAQALSDVKGEAVL